MTILTKDKLEKPRTAAEVLAWVRSALERFNTKALKAAAREGKCFAKQLTDEALPIALFAQRYSEGSPDVVTSHRIGNQQYDAIIDDNRELPGSIRFIETTVSDRDYTESLRLDFES